MRKILFFLFSLTLISCGPSKEEKDLTNAIYLQYKSDAIDTGTSVPFNILNLEIKGKTTSNDIIYYDVEFLIQEMYPSRRNYYDGEGTVTYNKGQYDVTKLNYHQSNKY